MWFSSNSVRNVQIMPKWEERETEILEQLLSRDYATPTELQAALEKKMAKTTFFDRLRDLYSEKHVIKKKQRPIEIKSVKDAKDGKYYVGYFRDTTVYYITPKRKEKRDLEELVKMAFRHRIDPEKFSEKILSAMKTTEARIGGISI